MSKTLIVYVHGALSSKVSWNYIRQNLKEKLLSQVAPIDVEPNELPQEEFIQYDLNKETSSSIVESMKEQIQKWVVDGSIRKIVMIGHSFGGVLSVQTIRELEDFFKANKVKPRLVTLSSPFAGSEIAAVLRMFKPNSLFFKNIGDHTDFIKNFKKHPLPCHAHIFVTTSGGADWMPQANDGVVTIESQSFFNDDSHASVHEVKSNHFEILLTDAVVNQLYKETK
jgi:pimeloyl-ACP methyl ester carboxylesterase